MPALSLSKQADEVNLAKQELWEVWDEWDLRAVFLIDHIESLALYRSYIGVA